jgi:hypothetical protein
MVGHQLFVHTWAFGTTSSLESWRRNIPTIVDQTRATAESVIDDVAYRRREDSRDDFQTTVRS